MKYSFIKKGLFAGLLIGSMGLVWAGGSVRAIMVDMAQSFRTLSRGVKTGAYDARTRSDIQHMMKLYEDLKDRYLPIYPGTYQKWVDFCDRSMTSLKALDEAWRGGDQIAAQRALNQLQGIKHQAHDEFCPGILKSIKNLFSKQKREEE